MGQVEKAPPREENWTQHLRDLSDGELENLASDYRWLDEQSHSHIQGEFHQRREAIIEECRRRGLHEAASRMTQQ
jgi:hypothetical protein